VPDNYKDDDESKWAIAETVRYSPYMKIGSRMQSMLGSEEFSLEASS